MRTTDPVVLEATTDVQSVLPTVPNDTLAELDPDGFRFEVAGTLSARVTDEPIRPITSDELAAAMYDRLDSPMPAPRPRPLPADTEPITVPDELTPESGRRHELVVRVLASYGANMDDDGLFTGDGWQLDKVNLGAIADEILQDLDPPN